MANEIASIYIVTDYRTGRREEVSVLGDGQPVIKLLRSKYNRHTKFVLDGFEIDGMFVPLYLKSKYND